LNEYVTPVAKPKKPKIPSLKIETTKNWPSLANEIRKKTPLPPVCNLIGPNRVIVKCQSLDDYSAARSVLKEKEVPFFTYQIQDEKLPEFAIRGIPADTP
jgi:hypothetical protein